MSFTRALIVAETVRRPNLAPFLCREMNLKLYVYENCDTCRKARKFLAARGIGVTPIPIRKQPPSASELRTMLEAYGGNIRRLFNTSGRDYRALNLGEKLPSMTASQAIQLLAGNGNLVKRPFLISDGKGLVGFNEAEWKAFFALH